MGFIGFSELLLILIVAFIVLGPEKMREGSRLLARFYKDFKKSANGINDSIKDEVNDLKKSAGVDEIDHLYRDLKDVKHISKEKMDKMATDMRIRNKTNNRAQFSQETTEEESHER